MPKNPTCVPKNTCVIQTYVDPISYIALLFLKSRLIMKKKIMRKKLRMKTKKINLKLVNYFYISLQIYFI